MSDLKRITTYLDQVDKLLSRFEKTALRAAGMSAISMDRA